LLIHHFEQCCQSFLEHFNLIGFDNTKSCWQSFISIVAFVSSTNEGAAACAYAKGILQGRRLFRRMKDEE
jgi:hypothetical protein